jgi:demethylmenaquinone methyltransferase/2-methoxy-6-polyprenyl-1,4-benzoquinol methylase
MDESYVQQEEYPAYYRTLEGLRTKIASKLPVVPGAHILDIATGYAYFAVAVTEQVADSHITGIDISDDSVHKARATIMEHGLTERISIVQMDAACMHFADGVFDMVVNFAGMEDIHMTRGREGIADVFQEVYRVLKPGALFCFVVMPVDEMETDAQKLEVALFSYICNATWLTLSEYRTFACQAGFEVVECAQFTTGKKLTAEQTQEEVRFACDHVPRIYGIATPRFEDVWRKFGQAIEKHGCGHLSKTVLLITKRT